MGMLEGLFGKKNAEGAPPEKLEKEMENVDNTPVPESADLYVVRMDLGADGNVKPITRAMASDKLIFTNISAVKDREKLDEAVKTLRAFANRSGGSIAMVSPELLIIAPPKVGIRREKPPEEEKRE